MVYSTVHAGDVCVDGVLGMRYGARAGEVRVYTVWSVGWCFIPRYGMCGVWCCMVFVPARCVGMYRWFVRCTCGLVRSKGRRDGRCLNGVGMMVLCGNSILRSWYGMVSYGMCVSGVAGVVLVCGGVERCCTVCCWYDGLESVWR